MSGISGMKHKKKREGATSKYFGVCLNKIRVKCKKAVYKYTRWRAFISKDGKRYYIGSFLDDKDAALAYNKKAIELFGDNAILNVV